MNLSPDMVQAIVYLGLVVVGMVLHRYFPSVKLPAMPSPSPAPDSPNNSPAPLRDELARLLDELLAKRLPALPLVQATIPATEAAAAIKVSTSTHEISVDPAGAVSVAVK